MNVNDKLECLSLEDFSYLDWLFVGKFKCGLPKRLFTLLGSGNTHKHFTRLERPARYKHSSLFWTFVNYSCKRFFNVGPRSCLNLICYLPTTWMNKTVTNLSLMVLMEIYLTLVNRKSWNWPKIVFLFQELPKMDTNGEIDHCVGTRRHI